MTDREKFVLVPVEADAAMIEAGCVEQVRLPHHADGRNFGQKKGAEFKAMCAARPPAAVEMQEAMEAVIEEVGPLVEFLQNKLKEIAAAKMAAEYIGDTASAVHFAQAQINMGPLVNAVADALSRLNEARSQAIGERG